VNRLEAALRRITADLASTERRWALIGALAVGARGEPRMTRVVDVAVAVSDDIDAEALVYALHCKGYQAITVLDQEAKSRLSTVRFQPPSGDAHGVVVDLLFASSGVEREVVEAADVIEVVPDLHVPVARIGHLLALKVLSRDDRRRPQDWDDLRALLGEADEADMERARASLRLIEERGFHRGKQLIEAFEEFVREHRPEGG
jgi:hypothetical protein